MELPGESEGESKALLGIRKRRDIRERHKTGAWSHAQVRERGGDKPMTKKTHIQAFTSKG